MTGTGLELDQGNRLDDQWDRMQQAAYDEAGAVVERQLHGQALDQSKLFAEAGQLKAEMAASGAFEPIDRWLAEVDNVPDTAIALPDDVPLDAPTRARVLDWETEARCELDALPPLMPGMGRNPEVEATGARLLFGPEGNRTPALEYAALNQMEAEFAALIAQLANEVDLHPSQPIEPSMTRKRSAPEIDF